MDILLRTIVQFSFLVFITTNILSVGFNVTVQQVLQPLRNIRLLVKALLINFVLVPLLMWLLVFFIPLETPIYIGLMILATAAGAPFLPKLAQNAKGNLPFSVGLMILLMVVSVIFMPLMLPVIVKGIEVSPLVVIQPLIFLMILPLGTGMIIKARKKNLASFLQPIVNQISDIALLIGLVIGLRLEAEDIVNLLNTATLPVTALFILISFGVGYLLGGSEPTIQRVLGLGTAQRNVSAAILVGATNFDDYTVVSVILVSSLLMLSFSLLLSWVIGRAV